MTKKIRSGLYKLNNYYIKKTESGEWSVYSDVDLFKDGDFYKGEWEITFQTKGQCVEWIQEK